MHDGLFVRFDMSGNRVKSYLGDVIVEPLSTLFPRDTTKVSCVIASHVFQHMVHSFRGNLRKQRLYDTLM